MLFSANTNYKDLDSLFIPSPSLHSNLFTMLHSASPSLSHVSRAWSKPQGQVNISQEDAEVYSSNQEKQAYSVYCGGIHQNTWFKPVWGFKAEENTIHHIYCMGINKTVYDKLLYEKNTVTEGLGNHSSQVHWLSVTLGLIFCYLKKLVVAICSFRGLLYF